MTVSDSNCQIPVISPEESSLFPQEEINKAIEAIAANKILFIKLNLLFYAAKVVNFLIKQERWYKIFILPILPAPLLLARVFRLCLS